jgi:anti-sigma factor RsiW
MTGRVLPLHGSEHAVADALLPWYVNGTLRGEELARVERHLAGCEICRREVDWLRELFAACVAIAPFREAAEGADAIVIPPFADAPEPSGWRARLVTGWQSTQPWARGLMAAQLAALAILGSLLAHDTFKDPGYRTLGASAQPASSRDAIAVMFDPATTEAELRRVITRAGARIIDGPTTTSAFIVEVPTAQSAQAVQQLRAEPRVRFAESLGARSER